MVCFCSFSYEDSWDCAGFLCCLVGIFVGFFGFLLGFLGDFIRNLQRYLCVVWLGFLLFFFGFLLVLKDIFLCFFLEIFYYSFIEILILIFMALEILVLLLCLFFWYFGIICKGYYKSNGVWLLGIITTQRKLISGKIC